MYPYIVADIGGTNARFALITGKSDSDFNIEHIHILAGADFASFSDVVQAYIDLLPGIQPRAACIAIAGPVSGDEFKMTNLDWSFSRKALQEQFGFSSLEIINDYTAVASAASRLTAENLIPIVKGSEVTLGNKVVLGPGTGLGVAGVVHTGSQWHPISCEAGHVNVAPSTVFEAELIKAAMSRFGHVSAETFLSGPGLVNLYSVVCDVNDIVASSMLPKDVSSQGLAGTNEQCVIALNAFCSFLGAFSGNLALTFGANGGVYLTGGILPRMLDFLHSSDFAVRFREKGIMSHYVESIPVHLINHPETAFAGAAAWLEQVSA